MPSHLPTDLLGIADMCQAQGSRPSASDLFRRLAEIDWNAQTTLYQPHGVVLANGAPGDELLRTAGWKVEDHPRMVGRDFVFEEFRKLTEKRTDCGGVFLIVAPAGVGKTALLTEWMRREQKDRIGFYFRYRDGRVRASAMPDALWRQLEHYYGLPEAPVPPEHAFTGQIEERLRMVAGELGPDERLLLFIDALDEADERDKAVSLIPKSLPARVFLIVSSRPPDVSGDHLAGLKAAGAHVCTIDPGSKANLDDVALYIRETLGLEEQARTLAEATGGSFMLATLMAEAIQGGALTVEEALGQAQNWSNLTAGERLFAYYEECWERACKLVEPACVVEFGSLLAVAQNWLSERQGLAILQWNEIHRLGRAPRLWMPATLKKTTAALNWLLVRRTWEHDGYEADFVQVRHQSGKEFLLALRHQSMRDFLIYTDGPVRLELTEMHSCISEYYLEQSRTGWNHVDPYGRFYAVRHMLAGESNELLESALKLLTDPAYLQASLGRERP